jgi:hypothetical protein
MKGLEAEWIKGDSDEKLIKAEGKREMKNGRHTTCGDLRRWSERDDIQDECT